MRATPRTVTTDVLGLRNPGRHLQVQCNATLHHEQILSQCLDSTIPTSALPFSVRRILLDSDPRDKNQTDTISMRAPVVLYSSYRPRVRNFLLLDTPTRERVRYSDFRPFHPTPGLQNQFHQTHPHSYHTLKSSTFSPGTSTPLHRRKRVEHSPRCRA